MNEQFLFQADSESDNDMLATVTEMTNATWHVLLAALSLLLDVAQDEPARELVTSPGLCQSVWGT